MRLDEKGYIRMGRHDCLRCGKIRNNVAHQLTIFFVLVVLLLPYPAKLVAPESNQSGGYSFIPLNILPQSHDYSSSSSPLTSHVPVVVNWATYHNYASLADLISAFSTSYPGLVDAFIIGKTWEGRDIFCIRMTDESVANSSKQQILIIAEHHAREVITQEAALYMIWYLLTNYQTNTNIQKLLFSKEIYIIPCLNPDGMEAALTYNPFQRKNMHPIDDDNDSLVDEDIITDLNGNGQLECYEVDSNLGTSSNPTWVISDMAYEGNATRGDPIRAGFVSDNPGGVDLNRNYGFHFNDTFEMSSNSTNPRVEDYKGPAPFSEPETRAVKQLVESHKFIFAMSLHSGTETLLRAWSYTTDVSSLGTNFTLFNMFGEAFEQSSGYPYSIGTGNIGYNTSGEFMDWMYGEKKTLAMGCEIYGNQSAYGYRSVSPIGDKYIWWGVWNYFNPSNLMIEEVCRRALGMLEQACSINAYSSQRITGPFQQPVIFNDGQNQLNLSWGSLGTADVAFASFASLPFSPSFGQRITPISHIFSLVSDLNLNNPRLSVKYSDQQLNSTNTDENSLYILTWDSRQNGWRELEISERDTERNIITVTLASTVVGNELYYFVLGSSSIFSPQTIVLLAATVGVTVGVLTIIFLHYRGKREQDQAQTRPS